MKDFGEQVDEFTSIYRKDFSKKKCERLKPIILEHDYPDIIAEPHRDFLVPDYMPNINKPNEYAGDFYHWLTNEMPKIKRYLDKEVDQDFIVKIYKNYGRSGYQVDYCKIEDGLVSKKTLGSRRIQLPSDWGDPPLTIQRKSYRDPKKILGEGESIEAKAFKPPRSELELSPKIKEILLIKTGETEYQGIIGLLGGQILKDKYHGQIELLPNEYVPQ